MFSFFKRSLVWRTWRHLQPFYREYWQYFKLITCWEGLQNLNSYVIPIAIAMLESGKPLNEWLLWYAIGMFALRLLVILVDNHVDNHIDNKLAFPIVRYLYHKANRVFMQKSLTWNQRKQSGELVDQVNNGISSLNEVRSIMEWDFIPSINQFIQAQIILTFHGFWPLVMINLGIYLLFIFYTYQDSKHTNEDRNTVRDMSEKISAVFIENVQHIYTAKIFGQSQRHVEEFLQKLTTRMELETKISVLSIFKYIRRRQLTLDITSSVILIVLIIMVVTGQIPVALLVFITTIQVRSSYAQWRSIRHAQTFIRKSEAIRRLIDLFDEFEEDPQQLPLVVINRPLDLELKNVSYEYVAENGDSRPAINNLSLTVPAGKTVAFVGTSGAGKSTLMNLVANLFTPQQGQITLGGTDLQLWPDDQFRQIVGVMPQGSYIELANDTVTNNLRYGRADAPFADVELAAKRAELHDNIDCFPQSYDTIIGERGHRLSGGQQQRAALARVLVNPYQLIIFDEPTSNLDVRTEHLIWEAFNNGLLHGVTKLIVAHRLSTVRHADIIHVMEDGQIVESGTHEELLQCNGTYASMHALDQQIKDHS